MMNDYKITNKFLTVTVTETGAELTSVKAIMAAMNTYGRLIQKFGKDMHRFCFQTSVA
nr:hypothetical protein [Oenococcus oeni]